MPQGLLSAQQLARAYLCRGRSGIWIVFEQLPRKILPINSNRRYHVPPTRLRVSCDLVIIWKLGVTLVYTQPCKERNIPASHLPSAIPWRGRFSVVGRCQSRPRGKELSGRARQESFQSTRYPPQANRTWNPTRAQAAGTNE